MKRETIPLKFKQQWLQIKTVFIMLSATLCMLSNGVFAQTTINTNLIGNSSVGGSTDNGITFAVQNTSSEDQVLTYVSHYFGSTNSITVYELWVSAASLSGLRAGLWRRELHQEQ